MEEQKSYIPESNGNMKWAEIKSCDEMKPRDTITSEKNSKSRNVNEITIEKKQKKIDKNWTRCRKRLCTISE